MKYIIPYSDITLASGKYFYRVKKTNIRICNNEELIDKVFDVDNDPCVIIPCGYYILCDECNNFVIDTNQKCPICRGIIIQTIKYTDIS